MEGDVPSSMKRFVTEKELEETRQRRQEEWEKARQTRPNLPAPDSAEAASSGKTLYEQLQLQKTKKEEEFAESRKFKNMIRGLDDEESEYLDTVSKKQMAADRTRQKEQEELVNELRKQQAAAASQVLAPVVSPSDAFSGKKEDKPKMQPPQSSISSLVKQAVKRKPDSKQESEPSEKHPVKNGGGGEENGTCNQHPIVRVVAVRPSLVSGYGEGSDEEDCESHSDCSSTSSSDSDDCDVSCDHNHKGDDLASFRPSIAPALVRRIRREMADGDE